MNIPFRRALFPSLRRREQCLPLFVQDKVSSIDSPVSGITGLEKFLETESMLHIPEASSTTENGTIRIPRFAGSHPPTVLCSIRSTGFPLRVPSGISLNPRYTRWGGISNPFQGSSLAPSRLRTAEPIPCNRTPREKTNPRGTEGRYYGGGKTGSRPTTGEVHTEDCRRSSRRLTRRHPGVNKHGPIHT